MYIMSAVSRYLGTLWQLSTEPRSGNRLRFIRLKNMVRVVMTLLMTLCPAWRYTMGVYGFDHTCQCNSLAHFTTLKFRAKLALNT
jgi:hypothetical protein